MNSLAMLLREGIGTADNIPDCEKTMDAAADDLDLLDAAVKELRAENERLKDRIDEHHRLFESMRAEIERLRAVQCGLTSLELSTIETNMAQGRSLLGAVNSVLAKRVFE